MEKGAVVEIAIEQEVVEEGLHGLHGLLAELAVDGDLERRQRLGVGGVGVAHGLAERVAAAATHLENVRVRLLRLRLWSAGWLGKSASLSRRWSANGASESGALTLPSSK